MSMFALCDGNSFYCSCERIFRPELRNFPCVALSNNDGCVIARTPEAKALKIRMGTPYYQIKHLVDAGQLVAFSSNFELYADISNRMMQTIASMVSGTESYSIDEAFCDVSGHNNLATLGAQIRARVMQWVGIPTCVGIGPTKTLAKFCNHLAKKYPALQGVLVWTDLSSERQMKALASEDVGEIWGIGGRISKKLHAQGIHSAWDFYQADTPTLRRQFGVVIERTQRELHGVACDTLHQEETNRKHIIRSRSFGQSVTDVETLEAAIAHHISSGATKLREQGTQAHTVGVYIHTNRFREQDAQYHNHQYMVLPMASSDTLQLNQAAQLILRKMFKSGYAYKKCGIELAGIESMATGVQQDLWAYGSNEKAANTMAALDLINRKFGRGSLKVGSELLSNDWQMNRNAISPCFTTQFSDLLEVS